MLKSRADRNSYRALPKISDSLAKRSKSILQSGVYGVLCVATALLFSNRASCEVNERDARRIRQIIEAGRANYLAFDNFVCRLRIRVGSARKSSKSSSTFVPEIATTLQTAEALWIRKGEKELYTVRVIQSTPRVGRSGEFVAAGYIPTDTFMHDKHHVMICDPESRNKDEPRRLQVSDDVAGSPMEILHTWNTNGIRSNDGGVIWYYLSDLLASVPKPRDHMVAFSVTQEKGRRLEKITLDLGGTPGSRLTVWTDPKKGYLAVRSSFSVKGFPPRIGVVAEARQFGEHWFPWKARVLYGESNTCFETEVLELKPGMANDSDFAIELRKGSVIDRQFDPTGKQIVLDGTRRLTLEDVPELLSEIASQPRRGSTPQVARRRDGGIAWTWVLLVTGALLVIVGVYFKIRST